MTAEPAVAVPGKIGEALGDVALLDHDRVAVAPIRRRPQRHAHECGEPAEARIVVERGDLGRAVARVGDAAEDVRAVAGAGPPRAAIAGNRGGLEPRGRVAESVDLGCREDALHERVARRVEKRREPGVVEREGAIERIGKRE